MSEALYQDGSYLARNPTWHEEDSGWKATRIIDLLSINNLAVARVAEVGCGGGMILSELSRALPDARLYGYEVSPQAFARCRPRETERLKFFLKDIADTDESYDLLLAIDVVEHVDDYIGFLRALRRHAGHLVVHLPLDLSVQTVLRASPILHAREKVGHLHYFNKETALKTLEYAGYRVVDWTYTHAAIDAPGRSRKSRWVAWMRSLALRLDEDWAVRMLGGSSMLALCEPRQ